MIRRLPILLSIILCVAIGLLWRRTLHAGDAVTLLTHSDTLYTLATHPNGLALSVTTNFRDYPPTWSPYFPWTWKEGWSYSSFRLGYRPDLSPTSIDYTRVWILPPEPPEHHFLGLGYESNAETWTMLSGVPLTRRTTVVWTPLWLVILFSVLPVVPRVARMAIRRRRIQAGRCISCGYDLRGSPAQCPECGRAGPGRIAAPVASETRHQPS
jgi:hypothetical protein